MRSLSEVLGAVIVLGIVVLSAVSIVRLGSMVASYAERESSAVLARDVQMGSPPTMSVVLRNSSLYLLVSSTTPINVSYAVLVVEGRVIVEKLDALVSGQALLDLMPNYSCQNVSIYLITSSGAVFRYSPWSDPTLMGRVPPGVDYFSCSLLNQLYTPSSSALNHQGLDLNGAVLVNGTYLVGLQGDATLVPVGSVRLRVLAYGMLCGRARFTVEVGDTSWSGNVTSKGQLAVAPLTTVALGQGSLELMGLLSCDPPSVGVVALPSSGLVRFAGDVNLTATLYSYVTSFPGMLTAEALGYSGNFTARGGLWFYGDTTPSHWAYYFYYTYMERSWARGDGVTPGPIVLASMIDTSPLLMSYGNVTFNVSAALNLTVLGVSGPANASLSGSSPIDYSLLVPRPVGSWPLLVQAYLMAVGYLYHASLTLVTQEGDVVRYVGSGQFLIPTSGVELSVEPVPFVLNNVSLAYGANVTLYRTSWRANWTAYAVPNATSRFVIPYLVEVNTSGYSVVFVPPVIGDGPLHVGAAVEPGPLVTLPLGLNVTGCLSPALAPLTISGDSSYVSSSWSPITSNLTPGTYVLSCSNGAYLAIVS